MHYLYRKNCEKKPQLELDQGIDTYQSFKRTVCEL